MLSGGTIIRYLFGQAEAIRTVASARSALVTGIILVFLTSIARNYDQTHISESPFKWVFGSLLFSLVSGTWLFLVSYCGFARREMTFDEGKPVWFHWPQFMGLFWMTAPVAWLYAIPVERFLEPVEAAKANVTLLAVVSLWRVLLTARVLQVSCGAPFSRTLLWVLFPATMEVLVIYFFGGMFAQAIMRGMGGLRNSPAEEVILSAMAGAFTVSFWASPVLMLLAVIWRFREVTSPLPSRVKSTYPWVFLSIVTIFWVCLALPNQRQLRHSVEVEKMVQEGRFTDLLAYYSAHERKDFAPSRVLPPKTFERESFSSLPQFLEALDGKEAPWVRELAVEKLEELEASAIPSWVKNVELLSEKEKLDYMGSGYLAFYNLEPIQWSAAIRRLQTLKEGSAWLQTKPLLLKAMANQSALYVYKDPKKPEEVERNQILNGLLELLKVHGIEPTKTAQ